VNRAEACRENFSVARLLRSEGAPNALLGGLTVKKTQGRSRYGEKASEKVGKALHEMKRGELKSGGSGKTVTNRKQAIAIGLSEAREAGGKVPQP
jgi:Family of unknown function (DUF6496)